MKVHLKQIPAQGLHLEGEEDCPIQELESEGIRCAGRLHYDLDLGVAGGALWANGSLSQPVELRCVSCLEKFAIGFARRNRSKLRSRIRSGDRTGAHWTN